MKKILYACALVGLFACGNSSTEFAKETFDAEKWKEDANGCKGLRKTELEKFQAVKRAFYELSERDLRRALGRPDHVDISKRKQKFYIYYIETGTQCNEVADNEARQLSPEPSKAARIEIRFSALERVNEVVYRPNSE